MRSIKPTTVRFTDDDKALIADLRKRYGLSSTIQVIRLALRMLAERPVPAVGSVVGSERSVDADSGES